MNKENNGIVILLEEYVAALTGLLIAVSEPNHGHKQFAALKRVRDAEKQILNYVKEIEEERDRWKARCKKDEYV